MRVSPAYRRFSTVGRGDLVTLATKTLALLTLARNDARSEGANAAVVAESGITWSGLHATLARA